MVINALATVNATVEGVNGATLVDGNLWLTLMSPLRMSLMALSMFQVQATGTKGLIVDATANNGIGINGTGDADSLVGGDGTIFNSGAGEDTITGGGVDTYVFQNSYKDTIVGYAGEAIQFDYPN